MTPPTGLRIACFDNLTNAPLTRLGNVKFDHRAGVQIVEGHRSASILKDDLTQAWLQGLNPAQMIFFL